MSIMRGAGRTRKEHEIAHEMSPYARSGIAHETVMSTSRGPHEDAHKRHTRSP